MRSIVFVFPGDLHLPEAEISFPARTGTSRPPRDTPLRFSTPGETRACAYPSSFTRCGEGEKVDQEHLRVEESPRLSFTRPPKRIPRDAGFPGEA